jgi:hypothetical protein
MVSLYWNIGGIITHDILKNSRRAEYGSQLLEKLAAHLTREYGKGYSKIISRTCAVSMSSSR